MDRLLENDTVLKVLSVLVAIFLWFQATASSTQSVNRDFGPVSVFWTAPANSNLNVVSIEPSVVTVQIKGPPRTVSEVAVHAVTAYVNLSRLTRPGTYTMRVGASVPQGTSLVSIVPAQVVVTVDQIGSRKIPITLRPEGEPNASDQLVSLTPSQKVATLTGPTNDLNQVAAVVGEVPVAGQSASLSTQVLLLPLNDHGKLVSHVEVSPPSVTANAVIEPKPPEKTVPVVARLSGYPASGYKVSRITVSPSKVTVTGSQSALAGLSQVGTVAIDVAGLTNGITEAIPLSLPKGVSAVGSPDVTVTVTITPTG